MQAFNLTPGSFTGPIAFKHNDIDFSDSYLSRFQSGDYGVEVAVEILSGYSYVSLLITGPKGIVSVDNEDNDWASISDVIESLNGMPVDSLYYGEVNHGVWDYMDRDRRYKVR